NAFNEEAAVQKVELVTYAYDPESKILYVDHHKKDDGFDEATGTFNQPKLRVLDWIPAASNVKSFKVIYRVFKSPDGGDEYRETRTPVAAPSSPKEFSNEEGYNQIGYPLFQFARIELSTEPASPQAKKGNLLVRQGGSDSLRTAGGASPTKYDSERQLLA